MTKIYFIRHAQSDINIHDGVIRPLTEKGMKDRETISEYLKGKDITKIFSSPYKRAVDTISDFAQKCGLPITTIDGFRERKSDSSWQRETDFYQLIERQWENFDYSLSDGECLAEVQKRNIAALNDILKNYGEHSIVIGTHGTALSTILNYYDNTYGFRDFLSMADILPWVVELEFDGLNLISVKKVDVLAQNGKSEITYKKADLYDINKVTEKSVLLYEDSFNELLTENKLLLEADRQSMWLAYANGRVAGFAHCSVRDDYVEGTVGRNVGYLEGIYTAPEYRRRGIARKLVRICGDWAREHGCVEFASDCEFSNNDSYKFHLSIGFKEVNRIICFKKIL